VGARVSVWRGPLDGPPTFTQDDAVVHYAASTIKVPLVITAYRLHESGVIDLDHEVPVRNAFRSALDGSSFSIDLSEDEDPEPVRRLGCVADLRWLCRRAIVRSSNLATNLLLDEVGPEPVAETLALCGATETRLTRGIEDLAARAAGYDNRVSAKDLASILRKLAAGELVGPGATAEILGVLADQRIDEAIPSGLPVGVRVEHKTGSVDGIYHDAGIVRPPDAEPYVLAVCTTGAGTREEAARLIGEIATASWRDRVRR
jgi:beta-lactamase class A